MKRNTAKFIFSLGFSLMVLYSFTSSVRAYYGNWTSNTAYAIYGDSQVGTTYTGGGGDAVVVVLTIKLSSQKTEQSENGEVELYIVSDNFKGVPSQIVISENKTLKIEGAINIFLNN